MPSNILMPALSPTMEKGNLAKWLKKEGDTVKAGDVIAEIETDKATMEFEAIEDGRLAKIVVPAGTQDVAVNSVIAVLAGEGEDAKAAAGAPAPKPTPEPAAKAGAKTADSLAIPSLMSGAGKTADKKTASATPSPQPSPQRGEGERPAVPQAQSPSPLPSGERSPPPKSDLSDFGDDNSRTRLKPSSVAAGEGAHASGGNRVFSSPLARRLAKEAGIDIGRVEGSGPHGRVVARDVAAAKSGGGMRASAAAPSAAAPTVAAPSDAQIRALYEEGSYEFKPHDQMRKIIAQRLTQSKQTIPHFYLTLDCDIGKLLAAREEINAAAPQKDGKPAYKISVNDFVIKALALALQRVPDANVTWTEGGMLHHKHSDVGVAVAIPGGLITPVVRQAETKSLSTISNEMKDFAARARTRHLKPHEYQGGSTAISNLGMYGIKDFAAVINPPHATILAVGVGEERAVVRNGQIVAAHIMTVTLSTDHRAVDGALGAEFLSAFKSLIEHPVMMVV